MSLQPGNEHKLTKSMVGKPLDAECMSSDVIQNGSIQQVDNAIKEPVQRSSSARNLILKLFDKENNAKDNLPVIHERDLVSFNPDVVASIRKYDKERLEERAASVDFELKRHKTKLQKLKDIVTKRYRRVSNLHIRLRNSQHFASSPVTFVEGTDESSNTMSNDADGQALQRTADHPTVTANNIGSNDRSVGMALPIYAQMSKPNNDPCGPASHGSIRRRTLGPSLRSENQDQHGLLHSASNKIGRMNSSPVLGLPGPSSRSPHHFGATHAFSSELSELAVPRLETTKAADMIPANLEPTRRREMTERKRPGLTPLLATIAPAPSSVTESASSITAIAPSVPAVRSTDRSGYTSGHLAVNSATAGFAINHATANTNVAACVTDSETFIATHACSAPAAQSANQTAQSSSLFARPCTELTFTTDPVTSAATTATFPANSGAPDVACAPSPPITGSVYDNIGALAAPTTLSVARPFAANQSTSDVARKPPSSTVGSAISALACSEPAPAVPHVNQSTLGDHHVNSAKHWLSDNGNVSGAPKCDDEGLIPKTTQSPVSHSGSNVSKSQPLTYFHSALGRMATLANQVKGVQPVAHMRTQCIQPAPQMHAQDFQPASQMHDQRSRPARQMHIQDIHSASRMHNQDIHPAAQRHVQEDRPSPQMYPQSLRSAPPMYTHVQTTGIGHARSCLAKCRNAQMIGLAVRMNPLAQHPVLWKSALSEQQSDTPIASPQQTTDNPSADTPHLGATVIPSTPPSRFSGLAEVLAGPEVGFLAANPSSPRSAALAYIGSGSGFTTPEPPMPATDTAKDASRDPRDPWDRSPIRVRNRSFSFHKDGRMRNSLIEDPFYPRIGNYETDYRNYAGSNRHAIVDDEQPDFSEVRGLAHRSSQDNETVIAECGEDDSTAEPQTISKQIIAKQRRAELGHEVGRAE